MKPICLAIYLPLLLLIGCVSPYADYYYLPHPGLVEIPATQPSQPPVVTAFATIVGIYWTDDRPNPQPFVGTRLRLRNNSADAISFDPHTINLTTGDLMPFSAPGLSNPAVLRIEPGGTATIDANFSFPAGRTQDQVDLSSLQLRWSVQTGTGNVEQTLSFQRHFSRPYYYSDPEWDGYPYGYGYGYPYPVVGGAIIIHRR